MDSSPPPARNVEENVADIEEIASQIRYQLSQMRAKNQHHNFERLAFHLMRMTVASNILPATGPVAAGGDQARDFETFRSYIASTEIRDSSFAALVSGRTIAFGCSLQVKISAKIRSDVATMLASGATLDEIHYLCEVDIPVAERHGLQGWARLTHKVHLEIHDGQAMATELTNREAFWIAQRYLAVSADLLVNARNDDLPAWYRDALKAYQGDGEPDGPADLELLSRAGRFATDVAAAFTDVPFWVQQLSKLYETTESEVLKRKAIIEIVAISMRSTQVLEGLEPLVRKHFADPTQYTDPQEIVTAGSTLTYALVSAHQGTSSFTVDELRNAYEQLTARVEILLSETTKPGLRADLLESAGFQRLTGPTFRGEFPDIEGTMDHWIQIPQLLPNAPFFHLSRFADRLTKFATLLGDDPRYRDLTSAVDQHVEERMGGIAAGEKGRDRALAFYEVGRVRRAIEELHNVKVKWFAQETLRGAVLTLLLLADWYRELGLSFAAKYYALSSAFLSDIKSGSQNLARYMGPALVDAAFCDWRQGAVASVVSLLEVTTTAFGAMVKSADDALPQRLEEFVAQLSIMVMVVRRLAGSEAEELERVLREVPLVSDGLDSILPVAEDAWRGFSESAVWTRAASELQDAPLSDTRRIRVAAWSALGIRWRVEWNNTRDITAIAEQFCAVLQITILDLSRTELVLLPTTVEIRLKVAEDSEFDLVDQPSNDGRRWEARIPSAVSETGLHDFSLKTLAMATHLLWEVSLLPHDEFHAAIEEAFKSGIANKIAVGRPYGELYRAFVREEDFHLFRYRTTELIPPTSTTFREASGELAWVSSVGPNYSSAEAERQIAARYKRSVPPISHSIELLRASSAFQNVLAELRAEGWKDWHVLLALLNVIINIRVNRMLSGDAPLQDVQRAFRELLKRSEQESDMTNGVPPITAEALREQLAIVQLETLRHWGLELRQRTPDLPAVERLLAARYRYWDDDVDHAPIFEAGQQN